MLVQEVQWCRCKSAPEVLVHRCSRCMCAGEEVQVQIVILNEVLRSEVLRMRRAVAEYEIKCRVSVEV